MTPHIKTSLLFVLLSGLLINCSSHNDPLLGGWTVDNELVEYITTGQSTEQSEFIAGDRQWLAFEKNRYAESLCIPGFGAPLFYEHETSKLFLAGGSYIAFHDAKNGGFSGENAICYKDEPVRVGEGLSMLNCDEWAQTHILGDSHYVGDMHRANWSIHQRIFEFPTGGNAGPINIYYLGDRMGDTTPDPEPAVSIHQNNTYDIAEDCVFRVALCDQLGNQQDSIVVNIEIIAHGFQFTNPDTDSLEVYTLEHIYLADKLSGVWLNEDSDAKILVGFTEINHGIGVILQVSITGEILDFGTIKLTAQNSIRGKLQITWVNAHTGTTWDVRMNAKSQFTMTPPGSPSFILEKE
jgi:hypothetical protein